MALTLEDARLQTGALLTNRIALYEVIEPLVKDGQITSVRLLNCKTMTTATHDIAAVTAMELLEAGPVCPDTPPQGGPQ